MKKKTSKMSPSEFQAAHGLTNPEAADLAGISPSTWWAWKKNPPEKCLKQFDTTPFWVYYLIIQDAVGVLTTTRRTIMKTYSKKVNLESGEVEVSFYAEKLEHYYSISGLIKNKDGKIIFEKQWNAEINQALPDYWEDDPSEPGYASNPYPNMGAERCIRSILAYFNEMKISA